MKKLLCLCLFACLLVGCQPKEKQNSKEEVIQKEVSYQFQLEPFTLSDEVATIRESYPNSRIDLYQANENKLLFGFGDPQCLDQVGATLALYDYDLLTGEIKELKPVNFKYHVEDAMVYKGYYLYMIKNKEDGTFQVIIENEMGQRTYDFSSGVGFMQSLKFDLGDDGVYYTYRQSEEDRIDMIYYCKITCDLERQELRRTELVSSQVPNLYIYQNNALFIANDKDRYNYIYLNNNELIELDYHDYSSVNMLKDYILFTNKKYYDVKTGQMKEATMELPAFSNKNHVYNNALIGMNEDGYTLGVKEVDEGYVVTENIYTFEHKKNYLEYRQINENEVLVMIPWGDKVFNNYDFYKLMISKK